MKKIVVEVTQGDIDTGHRRSACGCPVARAVARQMVANIKLTVCPPKLSLYSKDFKKGGKLPLPKSVIDFIYGYDRGRKVVPFSFPLSLPDWVETI